MIPRRRAALMALAALALPPGCAAPPVRRLASAAGGEEEGGIGGTGLRPAPGARPDEAGGIGGTGVFGTVTGIGSVLVNGLRLETWAGTAIETLARGGAPILPGDVVAAEAVRLGGRLLASRLAVFTPLVGPADLRADGALAVLGTQVVLPAGTPVRGAGEAAALLRPGASIAVSGLWRGEAVVAGSIRVLGDDPPLVTLRGQLRRRGTALLVGATRLDPAGPAAAIETDRFVTLHGVATAAGTLAVRVAESAPLGVFGGRVGALSVEGFMAPNTLDAGFHLAGFGLPLDPASPVPARPGQRQLFLGRLALGFLVDAGIGLPADPGPRAEALAAPAARAAIARWLAG